jgi:N-methylhydantoinase A/oxoprolinase/acetone carboxylase beta subunit
VLSAVGLAVGDERRDHVRSEVRPLESMGDLPAAGEAELRYRGQSFELSVPLGPDLASRFHELHEARYGYADRDRPLELVAIRTAEVRPGPALVLPAGPRETAAGPAALELDGATCWLPPGWVGARDGGSWRLTKVTGRTGGAGTASVGTAQSVP